MARFVALSFAFSAVKAQKRLVETCRARKTGAVRTQSQRPRLSARTEERSPAPRAALAIGGSVRVDRDASARVARGRQRRGARAVNARRAAAD